MRNPTYGCARHFATRDMFVGSPRWARRACSSAPCQCTVPVFSDDARRRAQPNRGRSAAPRISSPCYRVVSGRPSSGRCKICASSWPASRQNLQTWWSVRQHAVAHVVAMTKMVTYCKTMPAMRSRPSATPRQTQPVRSQPRSDRQRKSPCVTMQAFHRAQLDLPTSRLPAVWRGARDQAGAVRLDGRSAHAAHSGALTLAPE